MGRDPAITHKIMSSIKQRNTRPELMLRKELWKRGFRYRVNVKELPGKPDIVFTKVRIAVFCDGDFWHGHNWALRGISSLEDELNHYTQFWRDKISGNVERDRRNSILLESSGWMVIRVWESLIKNDVAKCADSIADAYKQRQMIRPHSQTISTGTFDSGHSPR